MVNGTVSFTMEKDSYTIHFGLWLVLEKSLGNKSASEGFGD